MSAKTVRKISSSLTRNYCSKKEDASLWNYFKKQEKPAIEGCKKRIVHREDPDLTHLSGQPYRTCGPAYVIQKDKIPPGEPVQSSEDQILAQIEADLSNKNNVDPMPPYQSVEQRLIDLVDRRLHPFYKRYMELPKRDFEGLESVEGMAPYKCQCGEVKDAEIPDVLKFNKEVLERKNIFADFKRVELPKQMLARMVEMERNRRKTLEKKEVKEVKKEQKK